VDIPGLIEGAHEGAGLGHEFLAHVERCKLLVHVLDLAPLDGSDPEENYTTVEHELAEHDGRLARLPRILALSKADLVTPEDAAAAVSEWRERLGNRVLDVVLTSSATRAGLDDLRKAIFEHTPADVEAPHHLPGVGDRPGVPTERSPDRPDHLLYRPTEKDGFAVEPIEPGVFAVRGKGIELLLARFDVGNDEALRHIEQRLRSIGVIRELERKGFESGDEIEIAGERFELEV
jgi:GTP-binding protein